MESTGLRMFSGSLPRAGMPSRGVEAPLSIRTASLGSRWVVLIFYLGSSRARQRLPVWICRGSHPARHAITLLSLVSEHGIYWFADVLWLTPAGWYAVAGRGSSLVYPYISRSTFPVAAPKAFVPSRLAHARFTPPSPRRDRRVKSSRLRPDASSSISATSPSWPATATSAGGAGITSTGS